MSLYSDLKKFTPRKEQNEALEFVKNSYSEGLKNILLDLPVGVGKSHIAIMIAEWAKRELDFKTDIITNSKILQDQYSRTYSSINNLKGKNNYRCDTYGSSCETGIELNNIKKVKCESCPYKCARESYIGGRVSLTNYHLFILNSMYVEAITEARGGGVLVVDEGHSFEEVMGDFISVRLTEASLKKYSLDAKTNKALSLKIKSIRTIQQYHSYCVELSGILKNRLNDITIKKNSDNDLIKLNNDLISAIQKLDKFDEEFQDRPDNWVLQINFNEKKVELSAEPIWSDIYLKKYIFDKYDLVIMMSGTFLSKEITCSLNGLDVNTTSYLRIPSPFKVENRPIIYVPLGKMSYTQKEDTFKNKYIPFINKLLNGEKYKGKKGIIHTNSFELNSWIMDGIKNERLIYHLPDNKEDILKYHMTESRDTVLVSPSMETGVSFDDDLGRFQIIAKIPYPSLQSIRNKKRLELNKDWYAWATCCKIQQASGRVVRSETDYGDTIIIDESFGDVLRNSSKYLTEWFVDSIKILKIK